MIVNITFDGSENDLCRVVPVEILSPWFRTAFKDSHRGE